MFCAKTRSLGKLNLKYSFKFLALLILLFSLLEGLSAHPEYQSLVRIKRTDHQKFLTRKSEEIIFEKTKNTYLGIFAGIYNIRDDRFKQIYEGLGYIYGFGLSRRLFNLNQHNFYLSLDFRFYSKKGKSTVTEEDTKLILRPISLGGAYMFALKRIITFAEIGVDYYPYKEKSALHSTSGTGWGFHLKGGALIPLKILKSLKGKIYFRYSEAKTVENDLEVNLGGFEYGIGIIYELNIF